MEAPSEEMIQSVFALASTWGLRVLGAVALLVVGRMVAGAIRRSVRKALQRSNLDESLVPFLSSAAYYLALTIAVLAVLNLFGIQTTSVIALLGAAGLAVGLALQGTLSNVAAGVMLLIFRPFRIGDYVEVAGTAGSVNEIGMFTTTLDTPDNVRIIVPNASVWGEVIKNYATNDTRRNDLVVGISYDDDIGRAVEVVSRVVAADARVLKDPETVVAVGELADSSVNLVVRPWCRGEDYWALRFDLTRALKEQLEAAGCSIPYPQSDVHVSNAGQAA